MNTKSTFVRHWKEKHEDHTYIYQCPICHVTSKRNTNILRHAAYVHGMRMSLGEITSELQTNTDFIDPHPYTLKKALVALRLSSDRS